MTNRELGDVPLTIAGRTYTLRMTTAAMVALEDLYSTPAKEVTFFEVLERVNKGSMKAIRAFLWAALQHHHKGTLTIDAVGDLIEEAGGIFALSEQLQSLGKTTGPDTRDLEGVGVPEGKGGPAQAKPRKAGTGAGSTSTLAASA